MPSPIVAVDFYVEVDGGVEKIGLLREDDSLVEVFLGSNGNDLPDGGTIGQILRKISTDNGDATWQTLVASMIVDLETYIHTVGDPVFAPLVGGVVPLAQIPEGITRDSELTDAITAALNALIDGAPGALNTLNEIAAAVNDDANFAATVMAVIATLETPAGAQAKADAKVEDAIVNGVTTKAPSQNAVFDALAGKSPTDSPTFTGTPPIIPNASADAHALNRITADARFAPIATRNLTSAGIWGVGVEYDKNDWVRYNGKAWVSLVDANIGHAPLEDLYWTLLAEDGLTTSRIIAGPFAIPTAGQAISSASFTAVTNFVVTPGVIVPIEVVLEGPVRLTTLTGFVASTMIAQIRLISDRWRTLTDVSTTAASAIITSPTAAFTADDVGEPVYQSTGNIPYGTYIASVTNGTTAVLSAPATGTATLTVTIGQIENFAIRRYFPNWVSNTNPAAEDCMSLVWRFTPSNAARVYTVQAHSGSTTTTILFIGTSVATGMGARLLARLP